MNKNGLTSRDREKKVGSWVFYVSGFFFISFFVAPMLVGTGAVSYTHLTLPTNREV